MKLTSNPLAVIILVILFGSIGITSALGWWATECGQQAAVFTQGLPPQPACEHQTG